MGYIAPAGSERTDTPSQIYISKIFDPKTVASAWSQVIRECPSTWGLDIAPGPLGSMLTSKEPMSKQTCEFSHL